MEAVKEKSQSKKKKKDKEKCFKLESDETLCKPNENQVINSLEGINSNIEIKDDLQCDVSNLNIPDETEDHKETILTTEKEMNENVIEAIDNKLEPVIQSEKNCPKVKATNIIIDNKNQDEFHKLMEQSKGMLNEIKLADLNNTQMQEVKVTKIEQKIESDKHIIAIRPYTESQLSALYNNSELTIVESFITQYVDAELKGVSLKSHPLYALLSNYLSVRERITAINLEIEQTRKEYAQLQKELWSIETATITGRGECQDGSLLSATHAYNKSIFHRTVFQSIIRALGNIQKLIYENFVLYTYHAEDLQLQIEVYIQNIISNSINVSQLDKSAPVSFSLQAEPAHLKPYLCELRLSISILFVFQRKLIREVQFIKETRSWLSRLISILLRLANYQDHLFILNHVLRCPSGISSWAASFIQSPLNVNLTESPFMNYQINHVLTVLAVILSPISAREQFLEDICQNKDICNDTTWVMIDSDGEEDEENTGVSLKENDLVSLLNQLPLDNLFRNVLLITQRNFQDVYDQNLVDENHLLKYLAFSTVLLKILHKGIQTYNQPRYNQFSKRLSRFIRHVTQYATDQWELFLNVQDLKDKAMLERLQVEYDAFFLRAIYYLYSSQKLGAWQFLAVIPYNMVSIKTLWKIFYFLHNPDNKAEEILNPLGEENYTELLWKTELRSQFEEKLEALEDAEIYYLLNTFANMALARTEKDIDFIFAATMDLVEVGFASRITQESCSKSARILLTHITSKYPHLLSNILKEVKDKIESISELALYLYEELPLSVWKITEEDLELVSKLLLNSASGSINTKLARMVLSRLNWDDIQYEFHCDVALLVVTSVLQDPTLEHWGWQMITRLKLHINDSAFSEIGRIQDIECYNVLMLGVREKNPLAIFVSLLMTSLGHSIPLICTKGVAHLLELQNLKKYGAVLFVLYQIVPLFLDSQECLINCEKYQEVLLNLLNSYGGYFSLTQTLNKSLGYTENTILEQFGNMIATHIAGFAGYGLNSPRSIVRLWVNSLVSIQNWNKDMGIMYLLDVTVRSIFIYSDSMEVVYNILKEQQQLVSPPNSPTGTISSLFKWVSNAPPGNPRLISSSLSTNPWLAYIMINIEFEEREARTGLWNEILIQLSQQKGKVNVDQAIKKAASIVKVPWFTSDYLAIYKWPQQAMETPLDHPLLPLFWQNFFFLYLSRIFGISTVEKSCVGEKFFGGLVNFAFFKKIKRRLQETVDYFQLKINENEEDNPDLPKQGFYQQSYKTFKAFSLWLEEPTLQENNLLVKNLPPQYENHLLDLIIQGKNTPWYHLMDYDKLQQEQQLSTRAWKIANFRESKAINRPLPNAGSSVENTDPIERILRRLTSYDVPKPAPSIKLSAPILPKLEFGSKEELMESLQPCFKLLKQFAHSHLLRVSEHKALDCAYQELVPQLYRSVLNKVKKTVTCKGKNQAVICSGPAVICLEVQEARLNERIDHQVETNRNAYESLVAKALKSSSINLASTSVTLKHTIKLLQQQLGCNPATQELGVELFYHILSLLNEEINGYPPTKALFSTCLEKLGQSHISPFEYEMPKLLQKILNEPHLGEYLAPHFTPSNVGTANLLLMYSTISNEIGQKYDITFALLSKFEVESWLKNKNPKISQRSQFIQTIVKALIALGFDPPPAASMLHCLYRKHLLTLFGYDFPEHYGEVLMLLLKASNGNPDSQLLPISVWMDILNYLAQPVTLNLKLPIRDQLCSYAQNQRILQHQELIQTAELLARHFTHERLQYGLYGLYPKCRNYMDVFVLFLGLIGHGVIVSMLNTHQGLLGDKLCEKIWPYLRDMFAPWIVPYSMQNLKENMAAWIQQLADDRSILLPWITSDVEFAQKVLIVFKECISFITHTLPASTSILSYIWQWYVTCYAHASVKDHILLPVHQTFVTFPWRNFWPSIVDVEFMLKVIDQYLPLCHTFLGTIFMSVSWIKWLAHFQNTSEQMRSRVYQCFINLLVKLSNEPNVKKNFSQQAKSLLVQAETLDWTNLDPNYYRHVMDWVVMSLDPSVIFKSDPLDLDYRVLHFLKIVSGYDKCLVAATTAEALYRRLIYVKTYIKLLTVYVNRNKSIIHHKEQDIYIILTRQLNHFETVVESEEEMNSLLKEIVTVLNIEVIQVPCLKAFSKLIESKLGNSGIMKALLQTLGQAVKNSDILADLFETAINSYFVNRVSEDFQPTWNEISCLLNILLAKQTELEQVLLHKGYLLTLNAILIQRISKCNDPQALLDLCLNWILNIKLNESVEPKVPLIWSNFLMLVIQHSAKNETYCGTILHKFCEILLQMSADKGNNRWGKSLLNVIGLSKTGLSINFRFLCHALAGYLLAQLPDMKGDPQVIRREPNAPAKVGQPGGNSECTKVLLTLDFGQSQGKIKECAELALKQIQDPRNSLHNSREFLSLLVQQFYTQPYLNNMC